MNVFDRYYRKYDAWYDSNKFAYLSELEALKRVLPKFGKGLEIGVGTGRFAHPLGITLGIDPSLEMLRIASQRGVNTRWGFGEDLPFLHETFNYVVIVISLCFVKNSLKVLQESHRVLKKNSKLIIGIVDRESFLGRFYQQKKSIFYKKAKLFSVKELTKLLSNLDFKRISYWQTLFDLPEKINSVQNPRKGFGEGGFVVISGEKAK
ncbi:MAG: class I SAM-dependent methyltransferase [Candidatus Omnitrophota bacterium]